MFAKSECTPLQRFGEKRDRDGNGWRWWLLQGSLQKREVCVLSEYRNGYVVVVVVVDYPIDTTAAADSPLHLEHTMNQ